MAVKIGSARSDERGKITGGKAGDQKDGLEVSTQNWYKHSKGWVLLRCKDPEKAEIIAKTMEEVCASPRVGYDQTGRNTLYNALKEKGFDIDKLTKDVETDCSALVVFCCYAAGITGISTSTITSNLATNLVKTGWFEKITDEKYTEQDDYLLRGDVLVTKTKGHTVVVLTDGDKAERKPTIETVAPENGFYTVTGGTVNIRTGPGTEYTIVHHVSKGEKLAKPDTEGWVAIKYGGHVYWISKRYVE